MAHTGVGSNIYLHTAFVAQSGVSGDDVWIAESGASYHMTLEYSKMYDIWPPLPGREEIVLGNGRRLRGKPWGAPGRNPSRMKASYVKGLSPRRI